MINAQHTPKNVVYERNAPNSNGSFMKKRVYRGITTTMPNQNTPSKINNALIPFNAFQPLRALIDNSGNGKKDIINALKMLNNAPAKKNFE